MSSNSAIFNKLEQNDRVIKELKKLFSDQVDVEVIESVAYEYDYDLNLSKNRIMYILGHEVEPQKFTPVKRQTPKSQHKNSHAEDLIKSAIEDIKNGYRVLVLLRGLPGSGKSSLATRIVKESMGPCNQKDFILSADDYFISHGTYKFDLSQLKDAHNYTQHRAYHNMISGFSPIIIDNTNTEKWELKPYCHWAVENTYIIHILEPTTSWAFKIGELSRRNQHNVPKNKIENMFDRYDRTVNVAQIFKDFQLKYVGEQPPKLRIRPRISQENPSFAEGPLVLSANQKYLTKKFHQEASTSTRDSSDGTLLKINRNFVNYGELPPKYPKEGFFDKGTNTDSFLNDECLDDKVQMLKNMFEDVDLEYLEDLLDKCKGDIDWAVDLLVEDAREVVPNYVPIVKPIIHNPQIQKNVEEPKLVEEIKKITPEESKSLKNHLESSVKFSNDHYSDHLLKIKGLYVPEPQAGPSHASDNYQVENHDSEEEFYDITDDSESLNSTDELIEMNLTEAFVAQLTEKFGDFEMDLPQGFQPVIEMPAWIGKQLYVLYLESILKQMDAQDLVMKRIIEEDENLAKKLQEEEFYSQSPEPKETPNFKQIMMDQRVASKMKKLTDLEWKTLTPDDLALRLSKEKLIENFPDLETETLLEIFAAHNYVYSDTFTSLIESGARCIKKDIRTPVPESTLHEMRNDHRESAEGLKDIEEEGSGHELRHEAAYYLAKRDALHAKAQQYQRQKMPEVAYFYSNLSRKQTQMYEHFNSLAAQKILTENLRTNGKTDTIDLHYLKVKEAVNALDIYLDDRINNLNRGPDRGKKSLYIWVITGRGNNSDNGIPRIRPAVQERLKKRKLGFSQVNPGLLRVKVFRNSATTDQIP